MAQKHTSPGKDADNSFSLVLWLDEEMVGIVPTADLCGNEQGIGSVCHVRRGGVNCSVLTTAFGTRKEMEDLEVQYMAELCKDFGTPESGTHEGVLESLHGELLEDLIESSKTLDFGEKTTPTTSVNKSNVGEDLDNDKENMDYTKDSKAVDNTEKRKAEVTPVHSGRVLANIQPTIGPTHDWHSINSHAKPQSNATLSPSKSTKLQSPNLTSPVVKKDADGQSQSSKNLSKSRHRAETTWMPASTVSRPLHANQQCSQSNLSLNPTARTQPSLSSPFFPPPPPPSPSPQTTQDGVTPTPKSRHFSTTKTPPHDATVGLPPISNIFKQFKTVQSSDSSRATASIQEQQESSDYSPTNSQSPIASPSRFSSAASRGRPRRAQLEVLVGIMLRMERSHGRIIERVEKLEERLKQIHIDQISSKLGIDLNQISSKLGVHVDQTSSKLEIHVGQNSSELDDKSSQVFIDKHSSAHSSSTQPGPKPLEVQVNPYIATRLEQVSRNCPEPHPLWGIDIERSLPSSEIDKMKLATVNEVLFKNSKLIRMDAKLVEIRKLCLLLAKEALFGDDILARCTPCGTGFYPALPYTELYELKKVLLAQFPQFWDRLEDYEVVWRWCVRTLFQECKKARAKVIQLLPETDSAAIGRLGDNVV